MNERSPQPLPFTKMQSLGNDFVILDATQHSFDLSSEKIQTMGHRRFGIGFDQLLILDPPQSVEVDFNYRIFNADGSEVEQCGNGVRCLARFIHRYHLPDQLILKLATRNRVVTAFLEGETVRVEMGIPEWDPKKIPLIASTYSPTYNLLIGQETYQMSVLSMGNPHAVIRVPSIEDVDVDVIGHAISTHKSFPNQVNVGFVTIVDRTHVRLRVYERGVGETMACGSGACSAVVVGRLLGYLDEKVDVELPGGHLQIQWSSEAAPVELIGSGEFVFSGYW